MVKNNEFEILFNNYFMCYSVQLIAWKQRVCPNFYLKMVKQPIQNVIFQKLVKRIFNHRSFDRNLSNCECCPPKRMLGFKEIETLASALALHCNDHIIICIFAAKYNFFFDQTKQCICISLLWLSGAQHLPGFFCWLTPLLLLKGLL